MRLIHCADLHLDSKMESNLSTTKAKERRDELMHTFYSMVDYAKDKGVKVIIIAGDMFDTAKNIQVRIKNRVLEKIEEAALIDFIYLRGNHDRTDFFENLEEKPKNLYTFTNSWSEIQYGNVSIYGYELSKETKSSIYSELSLKEDRINIVTLHGQESNYTDDNDGEIININMLQNKNIDYLALGHIHKYKFDKLDARGNYCYSGCLEGRGFDELGEKGFVLLDINEDTIKHEFIPFAKREFHEVKVELDGYLKESEISNKIKKSLADIDSKDLVKVILTGEIDEETNFDIDFILKDIGDKFYFIKIDQQLELKIKYEKYLKDVSLKGEFVKLVKNSKLSESEKKETILTGLRALEGRV